MIRLHMTAFALLCGITFVGTGASSQAAGYQVLYAFKGGRDGLEPQTRLINVGGTLYGTTLGGGSTTCGSNGCGTVFSLNLATGAEGVVHAFQGGSDGSEPQAGLIYVGGLLYGTTFLGGSPTCGSDGCGTVFSVNPATGAERVVHRFTISDGADPEASLIKVGARLYGTINAGGAVDSGVVFSLNPETGAVDVLHSFQGDTDGATPSADLIEVGGMLYGTTEFGGSTNCAGNGCGTVFSLDLTAGAERIIHSFQGGTDGLSPVASLVQVGGMLYGTTFQGGDSTECGSNGCGTVFSLDPSTGVETVVYSFKGGKDGSSPSASLIEVGRTLYGTTHSGGSSNDGTVFSFDPKTRAEMIVHSLQSGEGTYPSSSLILVGGKLYGTTQSGGATNCSCGTVFTLTP